MDETGVMHGIHAVKLDIELLKKDVSRMENICSKLDVTIEKLQELISTMAQMLKLHEQRLEKEEQNNRDIVSLVEQRRAESLQDIRETNNRVEGLNSDVSQRIERIEVRLGDQIKELRNDISKNQDHIERTLENISRWRWMVIGGGIVLGYILSHMDIFHLLV